MEQNLSCHILGVWNLHELSKPCDCIQSYHLDLSFGWLSVLFLSYHLCALCFLVLLLTLSIFSTQLSNAEREHLGSESDSHPQLCPVASCGGVPLSLLYFLFARVCWRSSLSWMVMGPTTRTSGRALPPLVISMMMGSQVGAFSREMSVGLVVLMNSSLGSCWGQDACIGFACWSPWHLFVLDNNRWERSIGAGTLLLTAHIKDGRLTCSLYTWIYFFQATQGMLFH